MLMMPLMQSADLTALGLWWYAACTPLSLCPEESYNATLKRITENILMLLFAIAFAFHETSVYGVKRLK